MFQYFKRKQVNSHTGHRPFAPKKKGNRFGYTPSPFAPEKKVLFSDRPFAPN